MELEPYIIVTGHNSADLQEKCQNTLKYEEYEDGWTFYYMPWGGIISVPNATGQHVLMQAFIVSSHPTDGDDDGMEGNMPYQQSGSGLN